MQVKVLLKQNLLPKLANNFAFSVVKRAFSIGNEDLYKDFYEKKPRDKKPFSFMIRYKGSFTGEFFLLDKFPVLYFSTNDALVLSAFLKGISNFGVYEFYLSEHLKDKTTVKVLSVEKKFISNVLDISNLLLPYSEKTFKEITKDMTLEEKVKYYFSQKNMEVKEILHLKEKKPIKHRIQDAVLTVRPIDLKIKVNAKDKETLMKHIYNGIGWFKSEGFGYVVPVKKPSKKGVENENMDKSII